MSTNRFPLLAILSPLSYEERMKVQENWNRISGYLNGLQNQLNFLANDHELTNLINAIDSAIANANTTSSQLQVLLNQAAQKLTVLQDSINAANSTLSHVVSDANTAIQQANAARDNANTAATDAYVARDNANAATQQANAARDNTIVATQQANAARDNANTAATDAYVARDNANTATQQTNTARDNANASAQQAINAKNAADAATQQALQAVVEVTDAIQDMIDDLDVYKATYVHMGSYQNATFYQKNNEVQHLGSTWRAKRDTLGNPPPSDFTTPSNDYWVLVARRGVDAPMDSVRVWRGATPPTDTRMLWWKDLNMPVGREVEIYRGEIPPQDTTALWLKPREGTQ